MQIIQTIQRVVFGVLPFGSVGTLSLLDVSIGLQIAGSYTLYFGELVSPYSLRACSLLIALECARCTMLNALDVFD